MNKFELNLKSYVEKCWPIIEYCTIGYASEIEPLGFTRKNHHIWYLYRQIYYGFGDYINLKYYYTKKANDFFLKNIDKFKKLGIGSLAEARGNIQLKFDPNRELILEHMLPGDMFRKYLIEIYKEHNKMLSKEEVVSFLEKYYKVCWVENKRFDGKKSENSLLPKSKRVFTKYNEQDSNNMTSYYINEVNIEIVNID